MKQKLLQFFILTAVIGALFGISFRAHAGINDNVSGWGWSDTIGWISLNCTDPNTCGASNYGVSVDTTQNNTAGNMSGYAWSDNIGWISFSATDTTGCPSGSCAPHIDMTTGVVTGWAKALAGNSLSGWDGWIRLGGNGLSMNTTTGALTGYAWGSTVVGWVSFNGMVTQGAPVLTLTASQTQLTNPGLVDLTWTSAQVQSTSCSAPWTTNVSANGTQMGVQVNQTTTFTITCMGNNSAPISANVTVTVTSTTSLVLQANPMAVQSSTPTTDLYWTSPLQMDFVSCNASSIPVSTWTGLIVPTDVPNATNGYTHGPRTVTVTSPPLSSTVYTITCLTAANQSVSATATVSVFAPTPSVTLTANPTSLPQAGGSSDLTWVANNVTSCSASANPSGWSGSKSPSGGTETVPSITTTTMFTITCLSPYSPSTVTASTTVYVVGSPPCSTCSPQPPPKPKFIEF